MPRLSNDEDETHVRGGRKSCHVLCTYSFQIDFCFVQSFVKKKKKFWRHPRYRCPTSSSRYVTESGNGRPDIDLRSNVAAGWGPLVSLHPTGTLRQGRFRATNRASTIDLCGGINPPSSLSRRCLIYLQWRRRDTHRRTHTNGTVEKAALCRGWELEEGWRRGGWFRCRRSRWVSSKKRRSSRWWHVRNRHVRSAFGADSGRADEEVKERGCGNIESVRRSSSCPECDAAVASRAPRSSRKIVVLNSHAAAPTVRHEARMTYGPYRRTGEG